MSKNPFLSSTILLPFALMESLYLGRLRRKPDAFAGSVLAHVPRHLVPEHGTPVFPVLRSFEAVTLIEQRAA